MYLTMLLIRSRDHENFSRRTADDKFISASAFHDALKAFYLAAYCSKADTLIMLLRTVKSWNNMAFPD